jgi:hypothetical protein
MVKKKIRIAGRSRIERLYGRKGFTDKILEALPKAWHARGDIHVGELSSDNLLGIASMLPKENLNDRHNFAPKVKDFVALAKKDPNILFRAYVVPKSRADERFSIDGVFIPKERKDLVSFIKKKAKDKPDIESEAGEYYYLWWD